MMDSERVKAKLAETLQLPQEAMMNLPVVKLVADREVIIENHDGIIEFSNERMKIRTCAGLLQISGHSLMIGQIDQYIICIRGKIIKFEYV